MSIIAMDIKEIFYLFLWGASCKNFMLTWARGELKYI